MKFYQENATIFIPDQLSEVDAFVRTTHLCIAAHQDDIEIMAAQPIIECFQNDHKWFTGVVLTDGRGSPREGVYQNTTDEEMRQIRMEEQRKAAIIGEYSALVSLDYPSSEIKEASKDDSVNDILQILRYTKPEVVYTHNLADKHDTHVAVILRVISALRRLDPEERPQKVYGCEVWRSLDWLNDADKVVMDLSQHTKLQNALLSVFESQIAGGKRYDLAAMSRRQTNATFFESHGVDVATGLSFALDLTPLMDDASVHPSNYINEFIHRFENDVNDRISRMS
ncbi:MAG TPA: PIG-L family deacetylase [Anaerolineaceae bacterium]|nr:PIG-L family deacetylase [Anaerolineaceae bacterium]